MEHLVLYLPLNPQYIGKMDDDNVLLGPHSPSHLLLFSLSNKFMICLLWTLKARIEGSSSASDSSSIDNN